MSEFRLKQYQKKSFMTPAVKFAVIDDRYWVECRESACYHCVHMKSYFNKTCDAFPKELPPEYWNNEKTCPQKTGKPDS